MKTLIALLLAATFAHAEEMPTLMTTRGKLLVDQQFAEALPKFDGKSNGFASGFKGWRHNAVERGGRWEVKDGSFIGRENPAVNHPATASYGFDFTNVVIQCEVRMDDVPLEGRKYRSVSVRTTDTKDYVCSVMLNQGGFRIQKDDNDHGGPDKAVPLVEVKTPLKLDEWHTVLFEILGNEMCVTVDGRTLTGSHPLITSSKCSIMFVAGVQSRVRNFRVWEATPNPAWKENKAKLIQK
ncbi:hypothetical protein [Prosthecobacter sp.]|uniref:hypothetical protein n=1 Tax=Prosthecobacter sp. TaxID=1965333 RepID=UPI001D851C3D|nr:hypothetical protein [Prosthecobacter sp.]MCB1277160.1 hypothetical protein [Prosthecobacter sp.]